MASRNRAALVGILAVLMSTSLACADLMGGLTGQAAHVEMKDAGGLLVGDAVLLRGVQIGTVDAIALGTSSVSIDLTIATEHVGLLDPQTLFMVRDTTAAESGKVFIASNVCVDQPRGITAEQNMKGYSGQMARVLIQAGLDNPDCAARLVEQWVTDLEQALQSLEEQP